MVQKHVYRIHVDLQFHGGAVRKMSSKTPCGRARIKKMLRNTEITMYFQYCPISVHKENPHSISQLHNIPLC